MEEKTAPNAAHSTGCFVCNTAIPFLKSLGPSEATKQHFRNSRIEFLKGVRTLLDEKIGRLSQEGVKGTHVAVE